MSTINTKSTMSSPKVVVVGKMTPLQKLSIGEKATDVKIIGLTSDGKTSGEYSLEGVETLYVDFKQLQNRVLIENSFIQKAMSKHIPIVLENIEKKNLTALAGIGLSAKVAIVESRTDVRGVIVTVIESRREEGLPSPVKVPEYKPQVETHSIQLDESQMTSEQIEEAKKKKQPAKNKVDKTLIENPINTPLSLEELAEQVNDALNSHRSKREVRNTKINAEKSSLIDCASYYVDFNIPQRTWNINNRGQTSTINVSYDIVLYASSNPNKKYLKIRSTGSGVTPGSLLWNHTEDRGYFTEEFYQFFGPYYEKEGMKLENSKPLNVNSNGSVSVTTGFSIGASGGVDMDGPSIGIDASYSSSETVTNEITDFEIINSSNDKWAEFTHKLSKTTVGAYNGWFDIVKSTFWGTTMGGLPLWATNNMPPICEGVWVYPSSFNETETLLYFCQDYLVRNTWLVKDGNPFVDTYNTISPKKRYDDYWATVDFSMVQLPHLGIDAKSNQSSTYDNGDSSRAIDGDVDGDFWADSVTHTDYEKNPFWEVTLDKKFKNKVIEKIEVWNRTDSSSDRLKNYHLFMSNKPFSSTDLQTTINQANNGEISNYYHNGENGRKTEIRVGRAARYIRIQLDGTDYLSLAEVRIIPKIY